MNNVKLQLNDILCSVIKKVPVSFLLNDVTEIQFIEICWFKKHSFKKMVKYMIY